MPYVITTKRATHVKLLGPESYRYGLVQRRAVATLDEARDALRSDLASRGVWGTEPVEAFDEQGGTVGVIQDGTTITVESIEWARLATLVGRGDNHRALIAAFNAAQESDRAAR